MAWFYGQGIIPICMYVFACMYVLMIGHAIIYILIVLSEVSCYLCSISWCVLYIYSGS